MSKPERHLITVELNARPGETLQDTIEWIQKSFTYYHPRTEAVVKVKSCQVSQVAQPAPEPTLSEEDLSLL